MRNIQYYLVFHGCLVDAPDKGWEGGAGELSHVVVSDVCSTEVLEDLQFQLY